MEGISANVYKGLKGYWKRRGYKRLNDNNANNNNDPLPLDERVEARSEADPNMVRRKKRRFFRVKITKRMRIFRRVVGVPKKWMTRLRDAYVKMMLNLANSGLVSGGGITGFGGPVQYGYGSGNYNKGQLKEYDEKMIVEIYKSLMIAQGQIGGATKINPHQQPQHFRGSPPKISISTR